MRMEPKIHAANCMSIGYAKLREEISFVTVKGGSEL